MNLVFVILLFAILFSYILYLHILIHKKTNEIHHIVLKLSQIEKFWEKDYVIDYIKSLVESKSLITAKSKNDVLDQQTTKEFIFDNKEECNIYIHYTFSKEIADKIIIEGFKFIDNFHKTAEQLSNDEVDLMYKHSLRKLYGDFIVVICISIEIFEFYLNELKKANISDAISVEQILTDLPTEINDNGEEVYMLSNKYIKGYLNFVTGGFYENPDFNPNYKSKKFLENIRIKEI